MAIEVKSKYREDVLDVGPGWIIEKMINGKINDVKDDVVKLKHAKLKKYGDTTIYFSLKPLLSLRRRFSVYLTLFDFSNFFSSMFSSLYSIISLYPNIKPTKAIIDWTKKIELGDILAWLSKNPPRRVKDETEIILVKLTVPIAFRISIFFFSSPKIKFSHEFRNQEM